MSHSHEKSSLLSQGVYIFVYLGVLTLLEYFIAVTFNMVAVLLAVAVVKAALVMYYYMHIYKLNSSEDEGDHDSYAYKTGTNRIGLWMFLLSDAFVFGGLLVMRINLLGMTRPHLNQTLGLIVTIVLLVSSFYMNRGEAQLHNGDRQGFLKNTMITFWLGFIFLISVVVIEWHSIAAIAEPVLHFFGEPEGAEVLKASTGDPTRGPIGGVFFMMTGMHAFHVLTGLIFLAIVWINGKRGLYDEKQYPVEAAAVYWHFVDLVWIFFYPALYLIGTAV